MNKKQLRQVFVVKTWRKDNIKKSDIFCALSSYSLI